jgi:hypothetical protein
VTRLAKLPEFRSTVQRLRKDGWLDWHILGAVCGVAVNYRITGNRRTHASPEFLTRAFNEAIKTTEKENDPLSRQPSSRKKLCVQLNTIMSSTLKVLGFECRQRTPDFPAIARFLGERFNYWRDDIPHEDLFPLCTLNGS